MTQKNKAGSMILGVAFVWFTTHFGGGFASGAQIYSYYVRYGIWCLIMPAAAMLYNTVFFAYCLRFTGPTITRFMENSHRSFPTCLRSCISV